MGFFDNKPKKMGGLSIASMSQTLGASIYRTTTPTIRTFGIEMPLKQEPVTCLK